LITLQRYGKHLISLVMWRWLGSPVAGVKQSRQVIDYLAVMLFNPE